MRRRRRGLVAMAVMVLVAACSATSPTPGGPPVSAVDESGGLRLTLELERDTWRPDETIEGRLRLEATDGPVVFGGPGDGVTGFEIVSSDGPARSVVAHQLTCVDHTLTPDRPEVQEIWVGGWTFAELAFGGPPRLPAGEWTITAVADVGPAGTCGGQDHLRATIPVHVSD